MALRCALGHGGGVCSGHDRLPPSGEAMTGWGVRSPGNRLLEKKNLQSSMLQQIYEFYFRSSRNGQSTYTRAATDPIDYIFVHAAT